MSGVVLSEHQVNHRPSLIRHIAPDYTVPTNASPRLVGVLEGEGIGPEVVQASLEVLNAVADATQIEFSVERGASIGRESESRSGAALSEEVVDFCRGIFARGGAVLCGAGGSRFVYDLRKRFDLFCKIVPVRSQLGGHVSAPVDRKRRDVDFLLIRENTGGIYQGHWSLEDSPSGRIARHTFEYSEHQITRILEVSARIAFERTGRITVVWKESGIPSVSQLWRDCARSVADKHQVRWEMIDVDFASYSLLAQTDRFDVVVAPNLFGDVLGDLSAVLSGSRGLTFSGNYNSSGNAVYQTNHGAAFDLQGSDRANPVGQILSLAMMLRESFGLRRAASLIENSVRRVLTDGFRTFDLAVDGCQVVGTAQMAHLVVQRIQETALDVAK